jgi:hypothetical protein
MTASRCWWFSSRTLFAMVGVLVVVLCCFVAASRIRASYFYELAADFESMPIDDLEFTSWLRGQPGVVARTVAVGRSGRTEIVVRFVQSSSLLGHPRLPNLNARCREMGYAGVDSDFRDVQR